jgi:hypothetical protein
VRLNLKDFDENEERHKNVILFGMTENEGESLSGRIDDVLESACGLRKPRVRTFRRLGKATPHKTRPVKVCFDSQEDAQTTISHARNLKTSEKHKAIFLAPDRNPQERAERRELVRKLVKRREEQPERFHFIHKGKICSREHTHATTKTDRDEKEVSVADVSFTLSDILHSTLSKQVGLLRENINRLGAATEQAASISNSADSRLNDSIDKNRTQRRGI